METIRKLVQTCNTCGGDGIVTRNDPGGGTTDETCWQCGGSGIVEIAEIAFADNVFEAFRVMEATDIDEYLALSAANKERYQLIISAGKVALAEGSNSHTALWQMFGAETITRANLLALLEE